MSKRYGIVVVKKDGTAHMLIHDLTSEDQAVAIGKRLTELRLKELRPADDRASRPLKYGSTTTTATAMGSSGLISGTRL